MLAWLMTPGIGEQLPSLADLLGRPFEKLSVGASNRALGE
jgi:hypothetical protein